MRSRRLTPGRGRRNRGRVWPGPLTRLKRLGRLIELPLAVPGCGLFEIAARWTPPIESLLFKNRFEVLEVGLLFVTLVEAGIPAVDPEASIFGLEGVGIV